jgi:hypothetical protein
MGVGRGTRVRAGRTIKLLKCRHQEVDAPHVIPEIPTVLDTGDGASIDRVAVARC